MSVSGSYVGVAGPMLQGSGQCRVKHVQNKHDIVRPGQLLISLLELCFKVIGYSGYMKKMG